VRKFIDTDQSVVEISSDPVVVRYVNVHAMLFSGLHMISSISCNRVQAGLFASFDYHVILIKVLFFDRFGYGPSKTLHLSHDFAGRN
jgi:hypothetical protein